MAILMFSNPSTETTKDIPKKEKKNTMATKQKKSNRKKTMSPKQRRWLAAVKRHGGPEQAKKHWDPVKGVDRTLSSGKKTRAKSSRPQTKSKPVKKSRNVKSNPVKKTKMKYASKRRRSKVRSNPAPRHQRYASTSPGMQIAQDVAGAAAGFAVVELIAGLVTAISKSSKYATFSKMASTAGLFFVRKKISSNQRFANQVCIGASVNTLASAYNHFAPSNLAVLQKAVDNQVAITTTGTPDPNQYSGWNTNQQTPIPSTEPGLSGLGRVGRVRGIGRVGAPARILRYLPQQKRMVTGGGVSTVRV